MPLVVLALWLFTIAPDHPWRGATDQLLVTFAALALAFLGGTRWGFSAAIDGGSRGDLAVAILSVVIAWAALSMPTPSSYAILAVAFAALGAADALAAYSGGMPEWHGRLRMQVTPVAVGAMVLAFAATA